MADNDGILGNQGVTKMADIADDMTQMILEEGGRDLNLSIKETSANIQSASAIARAVSIKKFDEVDPAESAAIAKILG